MTDLDKSIATAPRGREIRLIPFLWRRFKWIVKRPFYALYETRLATKVKEWQLPQHIGIVMDGNRRYARLAGLMRTSIGHEHGANKLIEVLDWCYEAGIPVVTVWCFSIDNFNRVAEEVDALLDLFEIKTREMKDHKMVHSNKVRVRFIGELERLPESLRHAIREAEAATDGYSDFVLNIAMAYGGREEITGAFRRYLKDCQEGGGDLDEAIENLCNGAIERNLYTSGLPEPDLLLRTSGEERLSGFLLWQSAYSELYFCDTHWPSFRRIDFLRALRSYDQRQRRFGK